jgi:hypothetical protein
VQFILAIAQAADFHLAAVKFSFADDAKALVVERSPGSQSIFGAQDREAIIEFEMRDHKYKQQSAHCIKTHNRDAGWLCGRKKSYEVLAD